MNANPESSYRCPASAVNPTSSVWPNILRASLVVLLFLAAVGLTAPLTIRCPRNSDQTEAVSNARQIGLALFEFQETYGRMPDVDTIEAARQQSKTQLQLGRKTSNDFLRQLMAVGITSSEQMFHAGIPGSRRPDGILTGDGMIARGECGFTYLRGATRESNSNRPLLVTPMIPGTDRFDPKPFNGKAVVLKMDNSVTSLRISPRTGHVMLDGKNLMDPSHPVWEGNPPVIAWPDL